MFNNSMYPICGSLEATCGIQKAVSVATHEDVSNTEFLSFLGCVCAGKPGNDSSGIVCVHVHISTELSLLKFILLVASSV